jgi:hypothetical protein
MPLSVIGIRSRARLGEAQRKRALAAHCGLQPACALLRRSQQQDLVHVAEGAPDENVAGMAELLLGEAGIDHGKAAAAILRGDIDRVEADGLRFLEDRARFGWIECLACFHLFLERDQLSGDEAPRGFDEHPLLLAEGELHHRPFHSGLRFSANARGPSWASSLASIRCTAG